MNSAIKTLCKENIKNKSDYRKWAKLNHPDKISNTAKKQEATAKFSNVSSKVKEVFDENDSIDCLNTKKSMNSTYEKQPRKPMSTENVNLKKADCIRNVENWSKIQKHQRFDKKAFDPKQFKKDISYSSPKMGELISTIRELDNKDFEKHGKYFKHFIFSDVKKGGYGAKIIASSLVSVGFNHCFTPSLKIITPKSNKNQETFGVLSSTSIFDTSFTQKHVQNILSMYNKRPDNIHGENMRFIVLDSGFKEGVDLFDVKYVHIFENQKNNADLVQAIGRATRSCGQKGLQFVPNKGWKLHVYQYYLTDLNDNMIFNDYIRYAGIDINMLEISENIQKLAMISAVDRDLNEEINKYQQQVNDQVDVLELEYIGGSDKLLGCNGGKCGKRSTKDIPFSLKQMLQVYKNTYAGKKPKGLNNLSSLQKRKFFCELLQEDPKFCKQVNEMFYSIKKQNKNKTSSDADKQLRLIQNNDVVDDKSSKQLVIKDKQFKNIKSFENYNSLEAFVELENLPFDEFRKRINKIFAAFKYKPIKVENLCETGATNKRIVKYTESQQFVTNYFIPNHFAKGILIWHSVGTGKTCTAISVKSFLFQKSDYSIIWVTRSTLKEDIWKNMYESICDHVIREKFLNGVEESKLRKSMYSRFFPPMSYKQFSNLLEGKNDLHSKLVQFNGTNDILKNTLIIFDEAHKLYSKDLIGIEKPNMSVIEDKIGKSTTCKVMLMTGTPIADDPMEFFKLMNLIIKKNPFPTNFKVFDEEYLDGNNFSKTGAIKFQEKTKGLISYLDRRYDPRQFTQIEFHKKPVTLSVDSFVQDENCKTDAKDQLDNCMSKIKKTEINTDSEMRIINSLINESSELKLELKKARSEKNKVKVEYLVNLISFKKEQMKELKKNIKELKSDNKKNIKSKEQSCKTDYKQSMKQCREDEKRQKSSVYQNVLFEHCK